MLFKHNKKEDVIKRKSYYGFARFYPGKTGSNNYVIGESRNIRKKEQIRTALIILGYIFLFVLAFFITTVCINISETPIY